MTKAQATERARHLLDLVGLTGFEDKRPSELSGGMRQRASLCRSIIHKPDVLILDEPFGALDAFTREDLWCTMHDLREEEPFTCLLITHDLRESVFLADQVVVLSGGPAHTQYVLDVDMPGKRKLDDLYTPKAVEMLAILRHQIQVAQGRADTPPSPSPNTRRRPARRAGRSRGRCNERPRPQDIRTDDLHRRHHRASGNGRSGSMTCPTTGWPAPPT
jgi:NitT/TauT family transport system ATP-binding protein